MKKLELTKEQYEILIKLNNIKNFILKYSADSEYCFIEVNNVSAFQDEIYFNIVEEGMDQNGKVNEYGRKVYDLYDAILVQI